MCGQETTNKIVLARTRYKVTTVDRDYHVHVAVREATVGQMLPCEREGGNTLDPPAVAIAENDTPIDSDALVLNEIFAVKFFTNCFKTANLQKFFPTKNSWYMVKLTIRIPEPPTTLARCDCYHSC